MAGWGSTDTYHQDGEVAHVLDELQAFYLGKADGEAWVPTRVLRQMVNRRYRERDYLAKRVQKERQALVLAPIPASPPPPPGLSIRAVGDAGEFDDNLLVSKEAIR